MNDTARALDCCRRHLCWVPLYAVTVLCLVILIGSPVLAHSPVVDSSLSDWCVGAFSNTAPGGGRVEDSAATLTCGNCSTSTNLACAVSADCPAAQTCVNTTSKTELAWWDNRTDGAVNDLGTVAVTTDNDNMYVAAELWVDPDPVSLPFGQIAIDYQAGGVTTWHDPAGLMTAPGHCSVFTDRACTSDADCHFCQISTEPFPSTRVRTCGSACDPDIGDVCDVAQTCLNLGVTPIAGIGMDAGPPSAADYLLLFDFSLWLISAGDAVQLMEPGNTIDATSPWDPVTGCPMDDALDNDWCDFPPAVNPGASGGSGGPPGSIEVAIPWSAFGCTGCPGACSCPGIGPGVPFRFTMTVARGSLTLDFIPDGAHEDVMSESVAGMTTTSGDSCAGFGTGNTNCEIADNTMDAYVPRNPPLAHENVPGGRNSGLILTKNGGGSVTLDWGGSCTAADTAHSVYEGMMGSYATHLPVSGQCDVSGTSTTFNYASFDTYYLVVPNDGATEGSYGASSTGERPVSGSACRAQSLGNCP